MKYIVHGDPTSGCFRILDTDTNTMVAEYKNGTPLNKNLPEKSISISVFREGDQFCAVYTGSFENIQESLCGFDRTVIGAIKKLLPAGLPSG